MQVTRQNAHSDYSLWVLEDTAVRRRSGGAIEPSQQPVDPGVGHLGDEVLVDEDVARLEVPVDQRRHQAVQVIQTCSSEFRLSGTVFVFVLYTLGNGHASPVHCLFIMTGVKEWHDLAILSPLAAPMAIDSLCLNSSLVMDSLPVSDEQNSTQC